MKILAIETSCDETAAAVAEGNHGQARILSNIVSSQIEIHKQYGGVVPEVAAREHVLNILPVVNEALTKAGIVGIPTKIFKNKTQAVSRKRSGKTKIEIAALAVTIGPGLITSLQVGIETAKVLAYAWQLPVIGINHIEGHIYANFVDTNANKTDHRSRISFPAVVLTVSGGHTMLVLMRGHGKFETIGETRDDAAGEAFDKAAKLMNLGYPGGPAIAKSAAGYLKMHPQISNFQFPISKQAPKSKFKIPNEISLPRPMINSANFDFSFSGLKTALRYELEKDKTWRQRIPAYAAEFQQAVIDVLIRKTVKAAQRYEAKTVMLAGGVSANTELRRQLAAVAREKLPAVSLSIPDLKYTTDNAAMIAAAGYFRATRGSFTPWQKLKVDCNAKL